MLLGPGASEVTALIEWDGPDVASLFDEGATIPDGLQQDLRAFDVALVCSRSAALRTQLGALVPRVVDVDPAPLPGRHAARWYAEPLAPLGIGDDADPPPLVPTDDEQARADEWCARLPSAFLAVHPGSGAVEKNWPAARFGALASALSPGRAWLLVCGPADEEPVAALSREQGALCARELPPRVLGALLARAGLFVGNDSGVTHLAAAFGARTLALFGPTDPAQWSPVGPGVTTLRGPDARLDRLEVDAVVTAARRVT